MIGDRRAIQLGCNKKGFLFKLINITFSDQRNSIPNQTRPSAIGCYLGVGLKNGVEITRSESSISVKINCLRSIEIKSCLIHHNFDCEQNSRSHKQQTIQITWKISGFPDDLHGDPNSYSKSWLVVNTTQNRWI
jgi:hypothetical protein